MNPSEKQELNLQLKRLIQHIDETIETVNKKAEQMDMKPHEMMYADGTLVMAPLLLAKAQAINAKVHLNLRPQKE